MDVLVALGTTAAWLYSFVAVIADMLAGESSDNQFFETSVLLIFFINLGKYLEVVSKGKPF